MPENYQTVSGRVILRISRSPGPTSRNLPYSDLHPCGDYPDFLNLM